MSDHSRVFVPIESWCFNSPEVRYSGSSVDIGLLSEALIYYDQVIFCVGTQPQFAELISWFKKQGKYPELIALLKAETLKVYDYSFTTNAVEKEGAYHIVNIQDDIMMQPNSFERRVLYHKCIDECLPRSRDREKLYKALQGKVIEVKAADFDGAIKNAREDYKNPKRVSLILQSFVDEVYPLIGLGIPPEIIASIHDLGEAHRIDINSDLKSLSQKLGKDMHFHLGSPLTAAAICNRVLWSASSLNCDLYLGNPMGTLAGDKLYESACRISKVRDIIQQLKGDVEFPNIRKLVNSGELCFDDVLQFRAKGKKFRQWLQDEGDRDRDAIIAYHNEVAKEMGILRYGRKSLRLFSVLGGSALGGYLGAEMTGASGAAIGSSLGAGVGYITDLASKLDENWKPVVFGNWVKNKIERIMKDN